MCVSTVVFVSSRYHDSSMGDIWMALTGQSIKPADGVLKPGGLVSWLKLEAGYRNGYAKD